jgi:hypothetical protein
LKKLYSTFEIWKNAAHPPSLTISFAVYNLMWNGMMKGKEGQMKRVAVLFLTGALMVLSMGSGYSKSLDEWLTKPGGSPSVVTHWFASEELHHGDIWRIYLEANDPDGDMWEFVCILDQVGYGYYSSVYVRLKKGNKGRLRGYLDFFSGAGMGLWLREWTQLSLTVFIRDKGSNTSNTVVFPLTLSRGAKQGSPPAPFDSGELQKLGAIHIELVNPELHGSGGRHPLAESLH